MNKQITILLSFFLVLLVGTGSFLYFQSLGDTVEDSEAFVPLLEDDTAEIEPSSPLIKEENSADVEVEDNPSIEEDTVGGTEPSIPPMEEGERPEVGDRPPIDDELGIFNLTRSLMTGLQSIIDEDGTSANVLDLSNDIEAQFTETIQGVELTDEQRSMVNMLLETLSLVQELAQDGESPSTILSQVRPNNRPN